MNAGSDAGRIHALRSGHAREWRERVYAAVCRHPNLTAGELARVIEVERAVVSRRLPELRADGRLANGTDRKCAVTGVRCATWVPWPRDGTGRMF